ncbi:unnamed protein product [Macrosiphum euphorbiae]|uniref:Uncharacterized protein n=1 Tax=Macrosiphum euphorbiae TaxID=13131 RepID=A0AAV0XE12_9HEMI|nr:unnamed protein product [Macrosiphum euphorbiae]
MIMSNIVAVQNTSTEVEIRSPSAESIALYRVFAELRNGPSCKIVLTSRGDFAGPTTSLYSSMPNMAVQAASAGDAGAGIDRFTVFRCENLTEMVVATQVKIEESPVTSQLRVWPAEAGVQQSSSVLLDHIEYVLARVSTETSEFENGRAKSQAQTAAVHASLLKEPV